jgi:UDP-glucose 4-epimerase
MTEGTNILITGGAGFIGSELVRQAAEKGCKITVVDNLLNGKRENLDGLLGDRMKLEVADIRDRKRMKSLMQGIDIVYHLACLCVRHSFHSPQDSHEINATATLQLISLAHEEGAKRFVFTSSAEVYGRTLSMVDSARVSEKHPTYPTNIYGGAKLAGEGYALAYYHSYGFPTVVLRLFNTFGPRCHHEGDCGEVIPKFMLRSLAGRPLIIFGDGTQTRDFNYVSDTARAILLAGLRDEAIGQTINIGSGYETSVNDLAKEVASISGRPDVSFVYDNPRPGDIVRMCADGTKAWDLLGYKPVISLRDGLMRLKEWYLNHNLPLEELLAQEVVHNWDKKELSQKV